MINQNHRVKPQIVIIDDDITPTYTLVSGGLYIEYGEENVHIFSTTNEGIAYIKENLDK